MRLIKFYFIEDGYGLAVEFEHNGQRTRNTIEMGKKFTPMETANALRTLARWCETLDYNTR